MVQAGLRQTLLVHTNPAWQSLLVLQVRLHTLLPVGVGVIPLVGVGVSLLVGVTPAVGRGVGEGVEVGPGVRVGPPVVCPGQQSPEYQVIYPCNLQVLSQLPSILRHFLSKLDIWIVFPQPGAPISS